MKKDAPKNRWAFFGSSNFSVIVLDKLEFLELLPQLIVTTPDKPKGRGLKIKTGAVKEWADKRKIPVLAPTNLKNPETCATVIAEFKKSGPWDVFLIASYGKIVPNEVLNIPTKNTLNIHPSLLPKFRGPSPIESAILNENETGVTIMKVDAQVDHGPIVARKTVASQETMGTALIPDWPPYYADLEKALAETGAELFAEILPDWIAGKIQTSEQDHDSATFTKKFSKEDSLIDLTGNPKQNLRKIRAFSDNRGAYFFQKQKDREIRVTVIRAKIKNGELSLERVKPEGKKEMSYKDFIRGLR
ncbi:MAG: methionyl-tRNA formyltransferase [Patescibacteria group bacterium]